jgi:beta-galactosidase
MNSWQPVTISTDKTILLENANYIIFRTEFVPYRHLQKEGGIIFLKNVVGKAEVWLNGQLVGTKDVVNEQDLKVEFLPTENKCELRVLLNGSVNKRVGLKGGVTVQAK